MLASEAAGDLKETWDFPIAERQEEGEKGHCSDELRCRLRS